MESKRRSKVMGVLIGGGLMAAAIGAVIFFKPAPPEEEQAQPVRPLKTMVIDPELDIPPTRYPGRVRATQIVDLAFQVEGPLVELPVKAGDEVEKGQLLAKINPRDYANELSVAEAELTQKKTTLERIQTAYDNNAATEKELIEAKAAQQKAEGTVDIRAKALEDTELHAPFAGVIARRYVDNFTNVEAKERIVSLQDVSSVQIEVNVPEKRISQAQKGDPNPPRFTATFDYLPGREFDVTLAEYDVEADPATQTYQAVFAMPAPEDVTILPGMTAIVKEYPNAKEIIEGEQGHLVPLNGVGVEEDGSYFVWKIDGDGKKFTAHKVKVTVGQMQDESVLVTEGLSSGDQIALAGVYHLSEDQQVQPMLVDPEAAAQ